MMKMREPSTAAVHEIEASVSALFCVFCGKKENDMHDIFPHQMVIQR